MRLNPIAISILILSGIFLLVGCEAKEDADWTGFGSTDHFPAPYENDHVGYINHHPGELTDCQECHGSDYNGGTVEISCLECHQNSLDYEERCNRCHGDAAGDPTLEINQAPESGAHLTHLAGGANSAAIKCVNCHQYPASWNSTGHIDSSPAEIEFSDISDNKDHHPVWDAGTASCSDTYCHGNFEPEWDVLDGSQSECGSCHTLPPPTPHYNSTINDCYRCHGSVIDENGDIINASLHVNGTVNP